MRPAGNQIKAHISNLNGMSGIGRIDNGTQSFSQTVASGFLFFPGSVEKSPVLFQLSKKLNGGNPIVIARNEKPGFFQTGHYRRHLIGVEVRSTGKISNKKDKIIIGIVEPVCVLLIPVSVYIADQSYSNHPVLPANMNWQQDSAVANCLNMNKKIHDLLKGIYLFKHFTQDEISKIAKIVKEVPYAPRAIIFYDQDPATAMYVVEYGSARLTKHVSADDHELATMGPGSHFGELPFLDGSKRSGTMEAIEQTMILEIPFDALKQALDSDNKMAADFYREVAHFLALRLRKISQDFSELKERTLKH